MGKERHNVNHLEIPDYILLKYINRRKTAEIKRAVAKFGNERLENLMVLGYVYEKQLLAEEQDSWDMANGQKTYKGTGIILLTPEKGVIALQNRKAEEKERLFKFWIPIVSASVLSIAGLLTSLLRC